MTPKRLSDIVEPAAVRCHAEFGGDPLVSHVTSDSRQVVIGSLFVCMPSKSRDTHALIEDAANAGAVACLVHSPEAVALARSHGLAVVGVADEGRAFNFALGRICREAFDDPSSEMSVVGITGTNGKTTTAWLVHHALEALGERSTYLGTLGYMSAQKSLVLDNTTPFPVDTWSLLSQSRDEGCGHFVMEASSHALEERRLAAVSFEVGTFTNFTQDHLDFHGTMEAYLAAKKLLFTEWAACSTAAFAAVLNLGDPVGRAWAKELPCPVFSYGSEDAMVRHSAQDVRVDGLSLTMGTGETCRMRLGGNYNVTNAVAAATTLSALGFSMAEALEGLAQCPPVPGRFEAVPNERGVGILVDYAHTPDALQNLLSSVRELGPKRVITVFGCGGDRDKSKRPLMAGVASSLSDVTVVTSDNPRMEDPESIVQDIIAGIRPGAETLTIVDRRDAVRAAIETAREGDVVVIAGKGHEDYQIIGREKTHMDDRELAAEALGALA